MYFISQVLSLVQDLLPPVSELNNEAQKSSLRTGAGIPESDLPSPHYAWVESEHPYKPAGLWNYKVKAINRDDSLINKVHFSLLRLCFPRQSGGCQLSLTLPVAPPSLRTVFSSTSGTRPRSVLVTSPQAPWSQARTLTLSRVRNTALC